MSDWYLGQLASQDPNWPEPLPPPQLSPHEIAAQKIQRQYRNLPPPGSSPVPGALADTGNFIAERVRDDPWFYPSEPQAPGDIAATPDTNPMQAGHLRNVNAVRPIGGEGRNESDEWRASYDDPMTGIAQTALNVLGPTKYALKTAAVAAPMLLGSTGTAEAGPIKKAADVIKGFAPGGARSLEAKAAPPSNWRDLPDPNAKFSQYAEEYPAAGPPVMMPKDKPTYEGEMYPKKLLTPEAKAFSKAREKIQSSVIRKGAYEPYFDPEQRFHVDPKNYPGANVDTLTLKPVRQETIDKYLEVIDAPQTKQLLQAAYKHGQELGNAHDWYAMGQLEAEYIKVLGAKKGREAFLDEFATSMAATTSGQQPGPNFMMSHYFETMRKRGEPLPASDQLPSPIGGRRAGTNIRDYENMRERGGYSGLGADQPKMHNFSRSFIGDLTRGVMDEQMSSGMLAHILKKDPEFADRARKGAFGLVEAPLHDLAKKEGVLPGNYQDVAWAGFKDEGPGKPMIGEINDSIERTHRLTGMPRSEIVRRGLVLKEIPMYGMTGSIGLGALAAQDRYRQ